MVPFRDEFLYTILWGFGTIWSFSLSREFPPESPIWNCNYLFFVWCLIWFELNTPNAVTNPSYWIKNKFLRGSRLSVLNLFRFVVLDVCGWIFAILLFVWSVKWIKGHAGLGFMEPYLQTPTHRVSLSHAIFVEFMVTFLTIFASPATEAFFSIVNNNRLVNLISSFFGIRIMIWGWNYTGSVMSPASTIAMYILRLVLVEKKFNQQAFNDIFMVYVLASLLGGIMAGVAENLLRSSIGIFNNDSSRKKNEIKEKTE